MNCPACNVELKMAERCGVEIDYCPRCRGVWLDRGELDKIIERSVGGGGPRGDDEYGHSRDYEHDRDEHRWRERDHEGKRKRRGGFFEDLFDF